MNIRIKLFATLRQVAGWSEQQMEVPEGTSVKALLGILTEQYPKLDLRDRSAYAAINQQYAREEDTLHDGDIVALFPPVSGGML